MDKVFTMQFLLEQYSKNKDQGLDYLKVGDYEQARYHLFIAVKYLLKAAQESEPKLREIRYEKAKRLRDLALTLKGKTGRLSPKNSIPPKTRMAI
jgi:HEPN domain-containing protein